MIIRSILYFNANSLDTLPVHSQHGTSLDKNFEMLFVPRVGDIVVLFPDDIKKTFEVKKVMLFPDQNTVSVLGEFTA